MDVKGFCRLVDELSIVGPETLKAISALNTGYTPIIGGERDALILRILKTIDSHTLSKTGVVDKWERCWTSVRDEFVKTGNLELLTPPFVHHGRACRLWGDYITTHSVFFEHSMATILRCWLYETYMQGTSDVFEFGCGSGWNVHLLAEIYPERKIHGLDWSHASVDIINLLREKAKFNTEGHWFDMFAPDAGLNVPEGSQVLTIGTLEQMGSKFRPFVEFLLKKRVGRVCHLEPIFEFYNDENLVDYLSIRFHIQRDYLWGYYPYLRELEKQGRIRIVKAQRVEFGSLFQNGWSILIWELI
jgi:SAM-dependent methyltransferase